MFITASSSIAPAIPSAAETTPIIRPGSNCWRVERAEQVAFLIDGAAYFQAFRAAASQARHTLFILGWDFDSRVPLLDDEPNDGLPSRIGDFLVALLNGRPHLHVFILIWDFHPIYALEREWWTRLNIGPHERLHFVQDSDHPSGACQHQKIAVVDDVIAFSGGLDFAQCRWDTRLHRPQHALRRMRDGRFCRPFHDVQIMVQGQAARALGELARTRWHLARSSAGNSAAPIIIPPPATEPTAEGYYCWPATVQPDLKKVNVAIARTAPAFKGRHGVHEVEALYLDAIAAARDLIYIETQYLTSAVVTKALCRSLYAARGPEIVLVLHSSSDGWLEQCTMDVLCRRMVARLRSADRRGRLAIYSPYCPEEGEQCICVHSKVLVVDDELLRIGSANLTNRSMRVDTECDLAIEADGSSAVRTAIARFRSDILGEHLSVVPGVVATDLRQADSCIQAIDRLRGQPRSLHVYPETHSEPPELGLPEETLIDPDGHSISEVVAEVLIPSEQCRSARGHIKGTMLVLLVCLIVIALAYWTAPLAGLDVETIGASLATIQNSPLAVFWVTGAYLLMGITFMPVTVLLAATMLVFGPLLGFWYSLLGMTASAVLLFGLGFLVGRERLERLLGSRYVGVSRRLQAQGLLTVAALRIVPVAPFSVINLFAGIAPIRFNDFLLGTVIGEAVGLLAITVFVDRLHVLTGDPGPWDVLFTFGVLAVTVTAVRWLQRHMQRPLAVDEQDS